MLVLMFIASCSSTQKDPTGPSLPQFEETKEPEKPALKLGKKVMLYSTFYYLPKYKSDANGIPLRNEKNQKLGPKLTTKKMCNAQLQGSVIIDGEMYGYWTKANDRYKVDCSSFSSKVPGIVKFRKEKTKYGTGVKLWPLTPFRSIAVKPYTVPYGTKLFIPKFKGIKYMFEGKMHTHDGIVVAQDTGGVLKKGQMDFFIGPVGGTGMFKDALKVAKPFLHVIKSDPKKPWFESYIID